jgi:hypothetical protein
MTKRLILKIILLLLVVAIEVFADADGPSCYKVKGVALDDVLWMHPTPNWKSKEIEKIPHNGIVQYTDIDNGIWMKVIYKQKIGWVNGKYLQESYCKEEIQSIQKATDLPMSQKIHESMKYSEARELLLSNGWEIVINREDNVRTGFETKLIDINGWKELSVCSGTGLGFCAFEFKKTDNIFSVTTAGDCINNKNGNPPKDDEKCELLVYSTNIHTQLKENTAKAKPISSQSKPQSFIVLNPSSYNHAIIKAVAQGKAWTRSPLLLTLHLVGDDAETRSVSIDVIKNSADSANVAKVIYARDGFLDDATQGDWYEISLIRLADGTWRIETLHQAFKCWRSKNTEVYQDEMCI